MDNQDFTIEQGSTFNPVIRYPQAVLISKPLTNITKAGQAVITVATHGLQIDWPVYVVGVVGMAQINNRSRDLTVSSKARLAYFVDANTLRLQQDTTRYAAYISGGEVLYYPPVDLTNYTARMQIRPDINSSTILVTLTEANGGIVLGGTKGTVQIVIADTVTAAFTFTTAVYDLDLTDSNGVVTRLLQGVITLDSAVTR